LGRHRRKPSHAAEESATSNRDGHITCCDQEVDSAVIDEKVPTVQYEFKLELDKQMTIGSFQSK